VDVACCTWLILARPLEPVKVQVIETSAGIEGDRVLERRAARRVLGPELLAGDSNALEGRADGGRASQCL